MKPLAKNKRIACLWFPDWPIQHRLTARPELARTVLLLVEKTGRGEFVAFANPWAARRGIAAGMPLTEARSLVSRRDAVHVEPMQPEADGTALEALALDCETFSPCVGLEEAVSPQSLLLDITGIAHLFDGELLFVRRLQAELTAKRFTVRIALADCVGAAWAAARYLPSAENTIIPCGQFEVLGDLPVEGLRLGESAVQKLHRLGIRTIRQVRSLSRSSLASRFGREINERMDQFLGERPEMVVPCRPQPKFLVEHSMENGITRSDIIEQWWSLLLERLVNLLHEQQWGTRQLQCTLTTDRKTKHNLTIRLCEATADARHLIDLLRLKAERLRLDAPLVGIRLEALEISRLERPQQALFEEPSHNLTRSLSSLLNRLTSRLGYHAVVRPRLVPNAVPERAVEYLPTMEEFPQPAITTNRIFRALDRPTCLLPQPRSVEVIAVVPDGPPAVIFVDNTRFDIVQSWGPERIETGWWQGPSVRRDYFHVATSEGRRFWLFRQLSDGQWFLQGAMF